MPRAHSTEKEIAPGRQRGPPSERDLAHRIHAGLNERGAVVKRRDLHILGQTGLNLRDGLFDPIHDQLGILAAQHDGPCRLLVHLCRRGHGPLAGLVADFDVRYVFQVEWSAVFRQDHNIFDVLDVSNHPDTGAYKPAPSPAG